MSKVKTKRIDLKEESGPEIGTSTILESSLRRIFKAKKQILMLPISEKISMLTSFTPCNHLVNILSYCHLNFYII